MTRGQASYHAPQRVRSAHVEWVAERLNERDWQMIQAINSLRLMSGMQLERLYFTNLAPARSRTVSRARALLRLTAWRVLLPLPRRIGGSLRGSSRQVFALDSVGQRLMAARQLAGAQQVRVRRPEAPGERSLAHTVAVSELYVGLIELARSAGFEVVEYLAEPACWWLNGLGGWIKPDAYTLLVLGQVRDHWWIEVDQATESLPTVRRKLEAYLDFLERGQLGPAGIMPRVLVSTSTVERREAVAGLVERLPAPADKLMHVTHCSETAVRLGEVLRS